MELIWITSILSVLLLLCPSSFGEILVDDRSSLGEWRSFKGKHKQLAKLTNYQVIEPKLLVDRQKRDIFTQTENGHLPETSFTVPIEGEEYILDMWINENLFPSHFVESSYLPDGRKLHRKPHETHHCYYHGIVRGVEESSVALSTCNGLSGVILLNGTSYYIEPLKYSRTEHLVYDSRNVNRPKHKCDYDVHMDSQYFQQQSTDHIQRRKRDVHTEMKFIELLIVNDYAEFQDIGSVAECMSRSKEMANIMDLIYRQLNIRVALVHLEVWNDRDQFTVSTNPTTTMQEFQRWRKKELEKPNTIYNDNAQLVTGKSFDGSTVGMASLGAMCSVQRSGGVNEDHGDHAADVASTMSHEMGHNMGFIHDTEDRKCKCSAEPNIGCIMEPSSGSTPPTQFSSCSTVDLSAALERGLGACLFDYPSNIYGGPVCGNGFLEDGEECDCGSVETCVNECCVPETCTLHVNATCAEGECCVDCNLKMAATLCRDRVNECDLPEYCTGRSNECPSNVYIQNGEACPKKEAADAVCFDGQCVTYTQQCKKIWGKGSRMAVPDCYIYNKQGSEFGNCGYEKDEADQFTYFPCEIEQTMCGKLMCAGGGDYPVAGTVARASRGVVYQGNKEVECLSASIDLGRDVPDPGFVANGSPCGHGKVCMDFKCLNLTELNIRQCPYNCHNNGVCNSKNHCHCNNEYAPPLCNTPGNGGSMDSGPATPPQRFPKTPVLNESLSETADRGSSGTVVVLLVLFLVVLPFVGISAIVAYLKRDKIKDILCKQRQKQLQNQPESNGVMNGVKHVARQPSLSKTQIQHPHHHNNRVEFHDITKVPESKPPSYLAVKQVSPPAYPGLRKPPSPPADALRPVRPPPPVPAGNGSAKPSALRPLIPDRPYNSVAARPSVTRPSVLPSGNNSVAARPGITRPSVLPTKDNRPPFLRPTGSANPNLKTVPLRPVVPKKASPDATDEELKPLFKPAGKRSGSVSSRPQISRPTLVSATTSDDTPVTRPKRPKPQFTGSQSVSSRPTQQRPSVLPSKTSADSSAMKPPVLRTNNSAAAFKPAVPKPSVSAANKTDFPSTALKPPKQALKPPGRPNLTPKPNANNSAQNSRPKSYVPPRAKDVNMKPKVAPRPLSVEVKVKPPVKPRKSSSNSNDPTA